LFLNLRLLRAPDRASSVASRSLIAGPQEHPAAVLDNVPRALPERRANTQVVRARSIRRARHLADLPLVALAVQADVQDLAPGPALADRGPADLAVRRLQAKRHARSVRPREAAAEASSSIRRPRKAR